MFADLKITDLNFVSSQTGFGPQDQPFNFTEQFDGRLFKPYNKREKIGKLVEFSGNQIVSASAAQSEKAQQAMLKQ